MSKFKRRSKFKKGDVIEREFMGASIRYKVISVKGSWYALKGEKLPAEAPIKYVDLYFSLLGTREIVNV